MDASSNRKRNKSYPQAATMERGRLPTASDVSCFIDSRTELARPGFVRAAAVDRRDFRAHGAKIDGQLSAMMDGMIVDEEEVEHRGEVERAEEINRGAELFRSHGLDASHGAPEISVVPLHEFSDGFRFFLKTRFHAEFVIGNFVGHLDVARREMPGEFPG